MFGFIFGDITKLTNDNFIFFLILKKKNTIFYITNIKSVIIHSKNRNCKIIDLITVADAYKKVIK